MSPPASAAVWQVDRTTGRMLYWRDDVVRVRPFRRDSQAAWRLRRVSHSECPQWAGVLPRRNQTVGQWAARIAATVLGECDAICMHAAAAADTSAEAAAAPAAAITAAAQGRTIGALSSLSALPLTLTPYLGSLRWLDHTGRMTICAIACRHLVVRGGTNPAHKVSHRLPGCICETRPPRPDCSCGGGVGHGPHFNVDATPLMHRLPAVWRMRAALPKPR
eukprot:2585838-Prymnesium_polylepis.2